MRALVWHGKEKVSVDNVDDPVVQEPTDALIRVTSSGLCGSDLHLYSKLGMFMEEGDIIGHEPMGVVEEVGSAVQHVAPGDRVVVPFNIACGDCRACGERLYSQCLTTQVTEHGKGAALFGYTKLYGQVPGAQAEYLRVPQAHFGPIKLPPAEAGPPDDRFLYLSDVLPTAWQAVEYAGVAMGDTVAVIGLGPIGQMAVRIARHRGAERVLAADLVPARLDMARRWGAEVLDVREHDDTALALRELTGGHGPDSVIDAVGMEAQGDTPLPEIAQALKVQIDRLEALRVAMGAVRRGGTLSITGVYAGLANLFPLGDLFDKQVQVRMGQANVRAWTDDILPLVSGDDDPLGTEDFATHHLPLEQAPEAYAMFQEKRDGAIKVVFQP